MPDLNAEFHQEKIVQVVMDGTWLVFVTKEGNLWTAVGGSEKQKDGSPKYILKYLQRI